jgi:pyrophosphatase PpaX
VGESRVTLRGLIFDLDGTLADNVQHTCDTLSEALSTYADRVITPAEVWAHFGPSEEGILQQLLPGRWELAADRYWTLYQERWATHAGPVAGLGELLDALERIGLRVGIVTGRGQRGTELTLDLLGIRERVRDWVAGDPTGPDKPGGLRRLVARWGFSAPEVAYVGDAPGDIRAARSAGVLPLGAAWCTTADPEVLRAAGALEVFPSTREMLDWVEVRTPPRLSQTGDC